MSRVITMRSNLFVLRFYGPVNPMGSCRAQSVSLRVITVRGKGYHLPRAIMVRTNGVRISRVIPNI